MGFKVAARTILQLGSELISSDSIAFYELIKNSFDARTKSGVRINVFVRMTPSTCRILKAELERLQESRAREKEKAESLEEIRARTLKALDPSSPHLPRLRRQIQEAGSALGL